MSIPKKQFYHGAILLEILENADDQISLISKQQDDEKKRSYAEKYCIRTKNTVEEGVNVLIQVRDNARKNAGETPVWDFRNVEYIEGYVYIFMCGNETTKGKYIPKACLITPENIEVVMDDQKDKNGETFHITISMNPGSQGSFKIRTPNSNKKELFKVKQKDFKEFFKTPYLFGADSATRVNRAQHSATPRTA